MNKITIIKSVNPDRVCKEFTKDGGGKIIKSVVANVVKGIAISKVAETADEMVEILKQVTSRKDLVLCAGEWHNDPGEKFDVLPEYELADLMGSSIGEVSGGVLNHDGKYVSARLKRGIKPSSWVLLDADNPPGIPDEWGSMSIIERLRLWEPLLPGISRCERIELRGSSARVINGSGSQKATHAWIRVSDPSKIALMKAHLSIEMVNKGLSFQYKKHSRIDPNRVVGIESRSVFDLAVFDTGRLVFTAEPTVNIDGYKVDDPAIQIFNPGGGELDINWIKKPVESLHQYREITGINMDIQLSEDGYISIHNKGQLTIDTEIVSKGVIKPLSEWVSQIKPGKKLRCESPFRESQSEAAFIKIGDDGLPFVHDVGNGTSYHLKPAAVVIAESTEIDTSWMRKSKDGQILPEFQNLHSFISSLPIAYDEFLGSAMIMDGESWRRFTDRDYIDISINLERSGFRSPSLSNVKEVTRAVLHEKSMDMAKDWANALVWDGVERVDSLFSKYFGVEPSPYEAACSMYFATAMAGRLLQPGVQADMVPVLIGKQGAGKTRSVMALAPIPDTYAEIDLGNTRDSDMGRQLRGKLICELGELKGLKSRDSEWIKSWITRSHEEWIPKYVEYATIMPRRCVFIGTSNEQEFLVDGTGNRRWLPMTVTGECDPDGVKRDCEQIWAEAVHYFKIAGVAWKPAQTLAEDQHGDHMVKDEAMLSTLQDYFTAPLNASKTHHKMADICQFIGLGVAPLRTQQLRVGDSLRQLGFVKKQLRLSGIREKVWLKGDRGDNG